MLFKRPEHAPPKPLDDLFHDVVVVRDTKIDGLVKRFFDEDVIYRGPHPNSTDMSLSSLTRSRDKIAESLTTSMALVRLLKDAYERLMRGLEGLCACYASKYALRLDALDGLWKKYERLCLAFVPGKLEGARSRVRHKTQNSEVIKFAAKSIKRDVRDVELLPAA